MGARILVIEDNPDSLELMTYLLKAFGHEAMGAMDGRHGLDMARAEKPDVILCDILLPDMDGFQIAREIKGSTDLAGIPLVAVTALAMAGDKEKVLHGGFDGYIPKPIDPGHFVAQVVGFLAPGARSPAGRR